MGNKFRLLMFILMLVVISATATAYYMQCYNYGEIIPPGTPCNSQCCHACMTPTGYTTLPQNCGGLDDCSCTNTTPTCTSTWECTTWSSCVNNVKTRTCTDSNSCGNATTPPLTESCNVDQYHIHTAHIILLEMLQLRADHII